MHLINDIQNLNVPDTTHTTGLVLEVSVARTASSEVNHKPILLNKALIDAGCTRTIIKGASLEDQFLNPGSKAMKSLVLQRQGNLSLNMTSLCNFHCLNLLQAAKSAGK
jgi:hypothetical protein